MYQTASGQTPTWLSFPGSSNVDQGTFGDYHEEIVKIP
jgi:hypothetical protein